MMIERAIELAKEMNRTGFVRVTRDMKGQEMTADSKKIDDGGPAFRVFRQHALGRMEHDKDGMSLRDWFASHALGMGFDWVNLHETGGYDEAAKVAYEISDAMIAARKAGA